MSCVYNSINKYILENKLKHLPLPLKELNLYKWSPAEAFAPVVTLFLQ